MASVWRELKRRNVVKVTVAYAIVGWLLIEVASTVFPILQIPDWAIALVTMMLLLGFPLALILSWAYELTPQGITRTKSVPLSESIGEVTGRKLDFAIIGLLALAVAFMFVDNYLPEAGPFAGAEIDPTSLDPVIDELPIEVQDAEEQRDVLPNSVAVLLCENLSPDPDDAYVAASIHDEILTQLRKIRDLNVIAKTSVLQYADEPPPIPVIAEELNVEAVMECSVRYAGEAILVAAQLIDPETNTDLWSDSYPGDLSDLSTIFAMQADIAMNIASALEAQFSLEEQASIEATPTRFPEAYDLYLRALAATPIEADILLGQAIEADPNFALAYAQKAFFSHYDLVGAGGAGLNEAPQLESLVQSNAERALQLDPTLGLAHAALAVLHIVNWRGAEAEQEFQQAIELSPNDANVLLLYGRFKRYRGELDDAIRLFQQAAELSPNTTDIPGQLAIVYRQSEDWEAAAAIYTELMSRSPPVLPYSVGFATVNAVLGDHAEAVRQLRIAERLGPGPYRLAQMAHAYALADRHAEAMRLFAEFEQAEQDNPVGDAVWARALVAVGDYESAFERLETAVRNRVPTDLATLVGLAANPWGDTNLEEPEFRALLDNLWGDE